MEKSDKLNEDINIIIDESIKPYYTDIFSPGETKQQLEIGKEVKDSSSSKYFCSNSSRTTGSGTGTQAIIGVGFTPKLIEITSAYLSTSEGTLSFGNYNGTTHSVYYTYQNGTASGAGNATNAIIRVTNNAGISMTRASVSSIDSDGFTLNWDTMGLDVTFTYKCYG